MDISVQVISTRKIPITVLERISLIYISAWVSLNKHPTGSACNLTNIDRQTNTYTSTGAIIAHLSSFSKYNKLNITGMQANVFFMTMRRQFLMVFNMCKAD